MLTGARAAATGIIIITIIVVMISIGIIISIFIIITDKWILSL